MQKNGKDAFDSGMFRRDELHETKELVSLAQEWFNKLVKIYLEQIQAGLIKGGNLIIHRAILICVLHYPTTLSIDFRHNSMIEIGSKGFVAEKYCIQCVGKTHTLTIHDESEFSGGIVHVDEINSKLSVSLIGDKQLQEEGIEIAKKIKRAGFLKNIIKSKKIVQDKQQKITEILQRLDEEALEDIQTELNRIISLRT